MLQHRPQIVLPFPRSRNANRKMSNSPAISRSRLKIRTAPPCDERIRKIGAQHRDTAPARRHRPAFDFLNLGRINRSILLPRHQPLGTQERCGPAERPSETARTRWRCRGADDDAPGAGCRPGSWWARAETRRAAARDIAGRRRATPAQDRSDRREIAGEAAGRFETSTRFNSSGSYQKVAALRHQALDLGEHPLQPVLDRRWRRRRRSLPDLCRASGR